MYETLDQILRDSTFQYVSFPLNFPCFDDDPLGQLDPKAPEQLLFGHVLTAGSASTIQAVCAHLFYALICQLNPERSAGPRPAIGWRDD